MCWAYGWGTGKAAWWQGGETKLPHPSNQRPSSNRVCLVTLVAPSESVGDFLSPQVIWGHPFIPNVGIGPLERQPCCHCLLYDIMWPLGIAINVDGWVAI